MRIAIIQSCYIPWKGFFDLIGRCDEYVIYDSAQYVKGHWHNRNRIKAAKGVQWLTIPVKTAGRLGQAINDVELEKPWADQHWQTISQAYREAPFFDAYAPIVQGWYDQASQLTHLTAVNEVFLRGLADVFALPTRIVRDDAYPASGTKTHKLVDMCHVAKATRYLSGPSAKDYFDEALFEKAGLIAEWMDYSSYPEYPQLHGPFEHAVSMIDVLFNVGANDRAAWTSRR